MSKLKLLLDENIGVKVAKFLRGKNYDVKSAIEDFQGVSDKEILEIAVKDKRVIVTLDTDFCNLVFRDSLPCRGIILLRLRDESPENINKILGAFLGAIRGDLKDVFAVVTESMVRIRAIKQ